MPVVGFCDEHLLFAATTAGHRRCAGEKGQLCRMKFLNVYCENRKAEIYISLDKIVLIQKLDEGSSLLELAGERGEAVKVNLAAEELVKKINGDDRVGIGFRTGR